MLFSPPEALLLLLLLFVCRFWSHWRELLVNVLVCCARLLLLVVLPYYP